MTRKIKDSPLPRETEGLAALLESAAEGRRVLYIGDGASVERLARRAERVLHLEVGDAGPGPRLPNVQRRRLRPGRIAFRPGSFDLVVAPDITLVPGDMEDVVLDLADVADTGLLAVGAPFVDRDHYEDFVDLIDDLLDSARIFGQDDFTGLRVSELGEEEDELIVLGAAEGRAPSHVFALAGAYDDVPPAVLAQTAGVAAPQSPVDDEEIERLEDALAEARARAEEADALERELGLARARADELTAREKSLEGEVARLERDARKLEAKLEKERDRVGASEEQLAELKVLESRLEARGEELSDLRVEVDRRGIIVRDLVEELRELRRRGTGGSQEARERALEAEARAESAALAEGELRARIVELEEALAAAERAQAQPKQQEQERAHEEQPRAASSHGSDEAGIPAEIREALGERDGLRLRVANLEEALRAARAEPAAPPADAAQTRDEERLSQLQAELMEAKATTEATKSALDAQGELVRRLQRDLASTEVALRAAEERADHDAGEIARLREALVEAVAEADRRGAEAEGSRTELSRLRSERATLEASEAASRESAESAKRALVETKAALVELESRSNVAQERRED